MSFGLTEEQRSFRDVLRDFVDARIAPNAARYDREQVFPQDSFDACVEMELPSLGIPEAYGGAGADMVTQAIAIEEVARGCASTVGDGSHLKLGMLPIMNFGSEEIKRAYLPRIASGEIQASYCLSEADAGSDVASMSCRAERDGDDYVLNGSKFWITNSGVRTSIRSSPRPTRRSRAGHHVLPRRKGVGAGVSPATRTRWAFERPHRRGRVARRARTRLHRIGDEGQGFFIAMHTLDRSRPTIGAQAVGIAQGAIDYAAQYMQGRRAFGAPISDLQGLRFMLADMAIRTEAARTLVYRACSTIDQGDPDGNLSYLVRRPSRSPRTPR